MSRMTDQGTDACHLDTFIHQAFEGVVRVSDRNWNCAQVSAGHISYPDLAHEHYARLEATSYWYKHRNRCLAKVIGRFTPKGPILDVGGGYGFVSSGLTKAGHAAIVLEPRTDACAVASERGLPVIQGDFRAARARSGALDAVALFDVIEHIEDDGEVLRDIRDSLSDEGYLYLTVPSYPLLWSNVDVAAGHYRRYTPATMSRLLGSCGFQAVFMTPLFSVLTAPLFILRTIPSILGFRLAAASEGREHALPDNRLGRFIQGRLDSEYEQLLQSPSTIGTSLLVVARKRAGSETPP
jgi:SAM-dependent methyltransferase